MGRSTALFLAGALATVSFASAHAADLLPPPPPLEAPQVEFSGWYLRGDVGVGITSERSVTATFNAPVPGQAFVQHDIGDTAFVGIGAGYAFNNWLRFDLTGEYRAGGEYSGVESYLNGGATAYDTYHAHIKTGVFLANAYFDLGNWSGFSPFFGISAGMATHTVASFYDIAPNGGFGVAPDHTKTSFAWAGTLGLSYAVSPNLKLEMAYRYLDMGKADTGTIICTAACTGERDRFRMASQDVKLGMRWTFSDVVPPPPPAPLVRKY